MKTTKIFMLAATGILFSLALQAKTILQDVNLIWKPTTELTDFKKLSLTTVQSAPIQILPLKDARTVEPKQRIGENIESKKEFLPVETKANVADFTTQHLSQVLKEVGLSITNEKATYVLSGELKDFFVSEKDIYGGLVKIHFTLKRGEKVIWQREVSGQNTRFGRSYKYDNYMESFSDSIIDVAYRMLESDDFRAAFQAKK